MGINGYLPDPAGPWGGVKSSGLGRELGPGAIAAYQNLKTLGRANTGDAHSAVITKVFIWRRKLRLRGCF